jgi:hypothetical protein
MSNEILTEENAALLRDARNKLRNELKPQTKTRRIQSERQMRAGVERQDGRKTRPGFDRTAQVNIKVVPAFKERLSAYCKRKGITLADWMEAQIAALGEG